MKWLLTLVLSFVATILVWRVTAQEVLTWQDPSSHRTHVVAVDGLSELEVLDWGGGGRPLVLLAGLGHTAHVFDDFAPKLTGDGRVYGITRRGYGSSSAPASGYTATRLGEDVLRVLDALTLDQPILIGHSIAGQELSYLASKHPRRIAGVVYLDAAYRYAYDWPGSRDNLLDLPPPPNPPPAIPQPTASDLKDFAALRAWTTRVRGYTLPEAELRQTRSISADGRVGPPTTPDHVRRQIEAGTEPFTRLDVPALAIFASPHRLVSASTQATSSQAAFDAFARFDEAMTERQASAFERGVPRSRVVRLRHATHYLFLSDEADVLRELRAFIAGLPRANALSPPGRN